jgi:hypothetical protein
MPRRVCPILAVTLVAGVVACAAKGTPLAEWRVLVKLTQVNADNRTITERASQSSGVPVRYVASVSPQWHGLSLACGDEARCAQALQALRADAAYFEVVQRDERRQPHPQPS